MKSTSFISLTLLLAVTISCSTNKTAINSKQGVATGIQSVLPEANEQAKAPFMIKIEAGDLTKRVIGPAAITGWNGGSAIQIMMGSEAIVITPSNSFTPFSVPEGSSAIVTATAGTSFWGYKN